MQIDRLIFQPKTIQELFFGERTYFIPAFQRRYQWTKKEVIEFLEDIDKSQKAGGYFLGPLLTYQDSVNDETYHLVDGQQRLTTVILYFSAYRKYISDLEFKKDDIDYVDNFILPTLSRGSKPKRVIKTSHPIGDVFFEDMITNPENFDIDSEEYETLPELVNSYKIIIEYLKDTEARSVSDNNDFFDFITKKVFFTEMVADNFTQAFIIFERMNDRGIELSEADKIKHLLLSNIAKQGQEVFDQESPNLNKDWEEITDRIKSVDTTMDNFLRYFFMAFYWTDKYKNTSAILPWLKDESNPVAIEIVFNPSSLLKKIKKYSKQFEKIRNGQDKDGKFNESISSLKRNYSSNRQHYPILLAATDLDDLSEYKKVCKLVDALIVVFSWAEAQWNDLEKELPSLCSPLRKKDFKSFETEIRNLINKHKKEAEEKMINPDKLDVFEEDKNSLAKHLMHKVEYQLQEFCRESYTRGARDTVEHILEKGNLKIQQKSKPPKLELEDYIKIRHRLGNQTIWLKAPNSANSNKTPKEKVFKEVIIKNIENLEEGEETEYDFKEGVFQGTKHMTTNLIINGTLDSDAPSLEKIKNTFSISGPEKLTSNEYWTIKNIENREKYIFHILSQALLINLDPHNFGYKVYDFVDWDNFEFNNKEKPKDYKYNFKNIELIKEPK